MKTIMQYINEKLSLSNQSKLTSNKQSSKNIYELFNDANRVLIR